MCATVGALFAESGLESRKSGNAYFERGRRKRRQIDGVVAVAFAEPRLVESALMTRALRCLLVCTGDMVVVLDRSCAVAFAEGVREGNAWRKRDPFDGAAVADEDSWLGRGTVADDLHSSDRRRRRETAVGFGGTVFHLRTRIYSVLDASLSVTVGGGVSFSLTVTNGGSNPVEVRFRDAIRADFAVESTDGTERWRFSNGRVATQAISTAVFAPGEEATFEATWPTPQPGEYTAVGELRLVDAAVRAETPFSV